MQKLTIRTTSTSYPIYIEANLLDQVVYFSPHIKGKRVMIITNETVAPLFLKRIRNTLSSYHCEHLILPDGEQYKNLTHFTHVIDQLIEGNFPRDTTLIALGGGVICDLTGFAAACYMRGIDVIHIPTTLLAQVDASVGGKTAINHAKAKNMIGAFYHPKAVLIDPSTLSTLPLRELSCGFAEIIKAALIWDASFFKWLTQHQAALMSCDINLLIKTIAWACQIKAEVIAHDEKDQHTRQLLNFGHTFGHAIEAENKYQTIRHGEAIAIGMNIAAQLSVTHTGLTQDEYISIITLLKRFALPTQLPTGFNFPVFYKALLKDKKHTYSCFQCILLQKIGRAMPYFDLSVELIESQISKNLSDLLN